MIINFYSNFSDLSHNELTSINQSSFEYLTKLEKLKLDHNQIAYVSDGAFNFTTNLRILYVYYKYYSIYKFAMYHCVTNVLLYFKGNSIRTRYPIW